MEEDIFNTELGKKILALTKASFKVSDLIPDLVLREKIKSQILDVYKNFFDKKYSDLLKEIDILDSYLFLAGHLNLIKNDHLRILRNGFLIFKSRIVLVLNESQKVFGGFAAVPAERPAKKNIIKSGPRLSERQEKILDKFSARGESPAGGQNKDTLKLAEILESFPNLSEKTVRNELAVLIGLKKITRSGQGGSSFYKIVR